MSKEIQSVWRISMIAAIIAALGVFLLAPFTNNIQFLPEPTNSWDSFNWYYWKLPDPNFWTRASSWGLYIAHQAFIWGAIYWAQTHRKELGSWNKIHPINITMLAGTAFFILMHYLQTAIFFDGLAQDIDVIWSQGSVIIMLGILLLMEAPRRGLFFGYGKPWFKKVQPFLFRTHGYYIAWATIFTFWYHPMYPTWGHITGFLYMFILFIQTCMIYTKLHVNRYWTFTTEMLVILHGATMAFQQGNGMTAMFFFGFGALVVITQMWGLGLSKAAKWGIAIAYLALMAIVYSQRGWENLNEVIRIPFIEYIATILFGLLLLGILKLRSNKSPTPAE